MEHLTSFFKDIWEAGKERIKNPFIGSFALAIIVWNWKGLIVLLFSDKSVEESILYTINVHHFFNESGFEYDCLNTVLNILIPFSFAVLYTRLLPVLMFALDKANKKKIDERKDALKIATIEQIGRQKEIATKQNELDHIKFKYKTENQLQIELDTERQRNELLKNEILELTNQCATNKDTVSELEMEVSNAKSEIEGLEDERGNTTILLGDTKAKLDKIKNELKTETVKNKENRDIISDLNQRLSLSNNLSYGVISFFVQKNGYSEDFRNLSQSTMDKSAMTVLNKALVTGKQLRNEINENDIVVNILLKQGFLQDTTEKEDSSTSFMLSEKGFLYLKEKEFNEIR